MVKLGGYEMKTPEENHDYLRKKLWCDAWVNTASSDTCIDSAAATSFADTALKEFDQRFKKPITREKQE